MCSRDTTTSRNARWTAISLTNLLFAGLAGVATGAVGYLLGSVVFGMLFGMVAVLVPVSMPAGIAIGQLAGAFAGAILGYRVYVEVRN